MRTILPWTLSALLLATAAVAQEPAKQDLAKDPAVQQSQQGEPTQQGTRPPSPATSHQTQSAELQDALAAVRRAPPDLNGAPVPRPNPLASEPDDPAEPSRSGNPSDLSSQETK